MRFHKMHALGNDFVVFGNPAQTRLPEPKTIRSLCNRRYGIGADCAVFIGKSAKAHYSMHIYNPDGFEAEMCGNALRCSAQYVLNCGFFTKNELSAETNSGIHNIYISEGEVNAQIGKPKILQQGNLKVSNMVFPYVHISMGNPHCVVFSVCLNDDEFNDFGYEIEHHPLFPDGTNVEFIYSYDKENIFIRVWERGIGETLSCSTGSCACVAAISDRMSSPYVNVHQPGGIITVETKNNGDMFIKSKVETVYIGNINI